MQLTAKSDRSVTMLLKLNHKAPQAISAQVYLQFIERF